MSPAMILPNAIQLEEAVLGAMLLERDKQIDVLGILPGEKCFYSFANQKIYSAIMRLADRRIPVDLLTVTEELTKTGELESIGGAYYITRLTMAVVSSAHVEAHARIVQEKYLSRELIRISEAVRTEAYQDGTDVFDQLDQIESELFKLSAANFKTQYSGAAELAAKLRNTIITRVQTPDSLPGRSTGYVPLDRLTYGLEKASLIIVAARPSVGKTAFAINLLVNVCLSGTGGGFFSLEMPTGSILDRMAAAMAHVPLDKIKTGNLEEWEQHALFEAANKIQGMNVMIDDGGALTVYELRAKGRRMVEQGAEILIIDYLQLMHAGSDKQSKNREQEIARISRDLKSLAKELAVPMIALSQLNRGIESRGRESKDPQLSDLRESGAIEQDADMVMFLTRPDYQKPEDEFDPAMRDDAFIHVAKSRNGKTGKQLMHYVKDIQKWFDLDGYRAYKDDHMFQDAPQRNNPFAGMPRLPAPPVDFTQPRSQLFIEDGANKDEVPF